LWQPAGQDQLAEQSGEGRIVDPSDRARTFASVSERSEAPVGEEARTIHVPVDPVDFEARLLAVERRLDSYAARDQALLEAMEAIHRLTDLAATLMKTVQPVRERKPTTPARSADFAAALPAAQVTPERLASAHARLRETLFADTAAALPAPQVTPERLASVVPSSTLPPGRKSWLLRALKRMVKEDPSTAGRLVLALPAAHGLAQLSTPPEVPWPPATTARLVVAGCVRRRIGWERAGLQCSLKVLSELAALVRLRTTPPQLYQAGARVDADIAFSLVAFAIEPAWTAGHRFTIAGGDHLGGTSRMVYLTMRDGHRPWVGTDPPPAPVATTISCDAPALLTVLSGAAPGSVRIEGDRAALELVQGWFVRATSP
jgi:hypothetical protein